MKHMNNHYGIPMKLQFFADGDGAGTGEGEGGGTEEGEEGTEDDKKKDGKKKQSQKTFDDVLQNKEYQAEFDRRLQKALETQKTRLEELMDDKLSEAERLAKMNKDEQQQYLSQKRERELEEREAGITKRELMAEAKVTLADKELPVSLAEVLNYKDADACKASIKAIEVAFKEAVDKAVEERLKGGKPPKKAGSGNNEDVGVDTFVSIIKENQSKR